MIAVLNEREFPVGDLRLLASGRSAGRTVSIDGRTLEISPVENSHALQSLTVTIAGGKPIEIGSDGQLDASALESALAKTDKEAKGRQSVSARIDARYVEMGKDKRAAGTYRIAYRWEGGGLFGGRSIRLISLSR